MNKSKVLPFEESTLANTPIGELIALFNEHLSDVEFPHVNASSLSELGCKAQAANAAISELERQLHSAQEVRNEVEKELLQKSQLALGYAKVYTEDNEELSAALSSIQIGRKRKSEVTRKPKRKTKAKPTQEDSQAALALDSNAAKVEETTTTMS